MSAGRGGGTNGFLDSHYLLLSCIFQTLANDKRVKRYNIDQGCPHPVLEGFGSAGWMGFWPPRKSTPSWTARPKGLLNQRNMVCCHESGTPWPARTCTPSICEYMGRKCSRIVRLGIIPWFPPSFPILFWPQRESLLIYSLGQRLQLSLIQQL